MGAGIGADFEQLGASAILVFVLVFLLCLGVLASLVWMGWWWTHRRGCVSPYSGKTLRRGQDLAFSATTKVMAYLNTFEDVENPTFDVRFAAVCPATGRIFPDCVNIFGGIRVDWGFIKRRAPGDWVSWGSLSKTQQDYILYRHEGGLHHFQTGDSCLNARPRDVDEYHALLKPGPLYVDVAAGLVMGWKLVPGTDLEVLVVQKPTR